MPRVSLLILALLGVWSSGSLAPAEELKPDLVTRRAQLDAPFQRRFDELTDEAAKQGDAELAERARTWLAPTPPLVIAIADSTSFEKRAAANDAPQDSPLRAKFLALRRERAEALFQLARQAQRERHSSQAWCLALEAVRENPDHAAARRTLGYQLYEGEWLTTFELSKAKSRQAWSDRFGWLPRAELARYEQGERYYKGRWLPAAEEDALRRRIENGWEVIAEHFVVRSNHSLEEAARLAARLERLAAAWRALFINYVANTKDLDNWFEGKTAPRQMPLRHQVWHYRSQDEYIAALQGEQPWIANTTGYYDNARRRVYLFHGSSDDGAVYHEATHQLFAELREGRGNVGEQANFWILEGIACFMESLRERDGRIHLGGLDAVRLTDARVRLMRDQFYEPFGAFSSLGMTELQKHPEIKKLYSQASGQTYFLLYHDRAKYRPALVEYLSRIYRGRDTRGTLAEVTGAELSTLDREYREFIQQVQQQVQP